MATKIVSVGLSRKRNKMLYSIFLYDCGRSWYFNLILWRSYVVTRQNWVPKILHVILECYEYMLYSKSFSVNEAELHQTLACCFPVPCHFLVEHSPVIQYPNTSQAMIPFCQRVLSYHLEQCCCLTIEFCTIHLTGVSQDTSNIWVTKSLNVCEHDTFKVTATSTRVNDLTPLVWYAAVLLNHITNLFVTDDIYVVMTDIVRCLKFNVELPIHVVDLEKVHDVVNCEWLQEYS